jgi:hypothetical protein
MKNLTKASFLTILVATALAGCKGSSSTTKTVYTTVTSSSSTSTTTTDTTCSDAVARTGATKTCYFTELPSLVFSGSGVAGYNYWSSANNLPSDFSKNNFRTDASFAVRIKPVIVDGGTSFQGRTCSQYTKNNFTKLQVKMMLSRTSDNGVSSNIKTLTADVGSYSNTARFTVPGGTTDPYVLSVYSVLSNHRCNVVSGVSYGTAPTGCPSAYYDIPLVQKYNSDGSVNTTGTAALPTECVGFEIQFATDDTYDLPN